MFVFSSHSSFVFYDIVIVRRHAESWLHSYSTAQGEKCFQVLCRIESTCLYVRYVHMKALENSKVDPQRHSLLS